MENERKPLLSDFALHAGGGIDYVPVSKTGEHMQVPRKMSPEQVRSFYEAEISRLLAEREKEGEWVENGTQDDGHGGSNMIFIHKDCRANIYAPMIGYEDSPNENYKFCPACGSPMRDFRYPHLPTPRADERPIE